jgi:response regulator RpfG family c-di-GMP phosphodiesterase
MSNPPQGHLHEQLLADNLVTPDQLEAVLQRVRGNGSRVEDVLIESGAVSEADLLKFLAKLYRTRFVATNKLARAEVDRALLEVIPRRLAEEFQVFPVLFDAASSTLSVVSPDAGDPAVLAAVKQASNARDVRVYVARPAAVRAAILKHYSGELYAFAQVDTTGREQYLSMIDLYAQYSIQTPPASSAVPAVPSTERRERLVSEDDTVRAPQRTANAATTKASFVELATVLVSRWTRKLADRIRLAPDEVHALVVAALLHDVGKAATYHLTALNVAMFDNHRVAAQKTFQTAIKLFEAVPLDSTTVTTLQTMYERFDGQGFPDGLAGKEIPLGARILAVVDTYADLTQNLNNPYRRQLTAPEACDVLDRHKGSVFDRNLVDLLRQVVTGDVLRAKLLSERTVVLLIDPDPEESTVLELRMVEEGFEVHLARNVDEAEGVLAHGAVEAVISETDLETGSALELLATMRSGGSTVPWVFLTRDQRREAIARAFELGANDYVLKPASPEVLIAKVKQLLAQRQARSPRGVSGSLAELALTDVVQVLSQGRKTGQLSIRNGSEQGEVHFLDGAVVNALWQGLRGEEAFFAMIGLSKGEFALDPTFRPSSQPINSNVEALMLEGLRRLDESRS